MMKSTSIVVFCFCFVIVVSSCARAPASQVEAPIETASAHYLVWWAVEEGGFTTALIREDADGPRPETLAEGDGLFIATADGIWSWEESYADTRQADCSCVMEQDIMADGVPDECAVQREVTRASLARLDGADSKQFHVTEVDDSVEGEYETHPQPTGSFGDVVTVTECSYTYGCGAAHGSVHCRFVAYDLGAGEELAATDLVEPLSQADQLAILRSQDPETEVGVESLIGLVEVDPTWDESGAASLSATYAASTCYACSDGEWSSYTFTATDERATPKYAIEDAPSAVLEAWRSSPGYRGWSRIAAEDVGRAKELLR